MPVAGDSLPTDFYCQLTALKAPCEARPHRSLLLMPPEGCREVRLGCRGYNMKEQN